MPEHRQVLRFAVGPGPGQPRSRTWRLWVPRRKSDVYIASRRLAHGIKVSLHEPGPARVALTREWVRQAGFTTPEGLDPRLAVEWERPRPRFPNQIARPFAIVVPWDEVLDRGYDEMGDVVWVPPPPEGMAVHFDVIYTPARVMVEGHPGSRSMGTKLIGSVELENGERVFVTWVVREIEEPTQRTLNRLRTARITDADGNVIAKTGMLAFGTEPNPDANDGTEVGSFIDVTRPDA